MKRCAILGSTDSRRLAPFGDQSVEIWTLNEHWQDPALPRTERIFDMHYVAGETDAPDRVAKLAAKDVEVVWQHPHPAIPKSIAYPLAEAHALMAGANGGGKPYLTNSVSYMIAFAILRGYEEIGVYGVDMAQDSEYGTQRPSCEFWLGLAIGRGIKVVLAPTSDLLQTAWLYGYDDTQRTWMHRKLQDRRDYLQGQLQLHQNEAEKYSRAAAEIRGALENQHHILNVWVAKDGPT